MRLIRVIMQLSINTFALLVVEYVVPGFHLASIWTAVVAAVAIGVVNTLIKPILQLVALPISILTFGISAFLINVFLLLLTSRVIPGFEIASFTTAIIASIALSLVSWFLHKLASE